MAASIFGHGSDASARALLTVHSDKSSDDLTVTRILKAQNPAKGFEALQQIGGYEIAALCGMIIAARLARIPVLLESEAGAAAIAVLRHENENIADHCALTGWQEIENTAAPYFAVPHAVPQEPGLAVSSLIPILRNQIILQGA